MRHTRCHGDQVLEGSQKGVIDQGNSAPNYCTLVSGALEAIREDFDSQSEC
jgi:hypothetical protein